MKRNLLTILGIAAIPSLGLAQTTYTWTGAVDGDWNTAGNWQDDLIPVDDKPGGEGGNDDGLSNNYLDVIQFNGSIMPSSNIPLYGGVYDGIGAANGPGDNSSPALVLNSGGAIAFTQVGHDDAFWTNQNANNRTILTVGDGIGPAGDVTLTMSGTRRMNRHSNGHHFFRVNSDGILIMNSNLNRWGQSGSRPATVEIDGGSVTFNDEIDSTNFNDGAVSFFSVGGTFTANFGDALVDLAAVNNALGTKFTTTDPLLIGTQAVDNLDNTFTVTAIEISPNYWTGNGGSVLGDGNANFTLNADTGTLDEGTLADVIALPVADNAFFGDQYFHDLGPTAVATSVLSTVTGGVDIADLSFANTGSTPYSVFSSDGVGITGSTSINLIGSGELTLTGDHTTTGLAVTVAGTTLNIGDGTTSGSLADAPISSEGALVYKTNGAAVTQNGALSGSGTLDIQGGGSVTVTANSGFNGATTITSGTLTYQGNYGGGSIDIASGSTFELNASAFTNLPTTTFTGTGTFLKTGPEQFRWAGGAATFNFGSGAHILVQEGIFRAGSNANEDWTNNLADLTVETGATFNTHEANVTVDAINGGGDIGSGFFGPTLPIPYENFTFGVDNGSGVFSGNINDQANPLLAPCSIVKLGTGTQELNGTLNGYSGTTTVRGGTLSIGGNISSTADMIVEEGTLTLAPGSNINFVLSGTSTNQIKGAGAGTGTVNLNGTIIVDLTDGAAGIGQTWTLVDTANMSGGATYDAATFAISSTTTPFTNDGGGIWSLDDGVVLWKFDEATGVLSYNPGSGARLWTGISGSTWDQSTTPNFMGNAFDAPIDNTDFDTANSASGRIGFADIYYDSGNPVAVGSFDVDIASGGVVGGVIDFLNTSGTTYTVTSSDTNGISGATEINVGGTGTVIFSGDHATTGTMTLQNTLTFDTAILGTGSFAGPITGSGSLAKTGAGVQTLLGISSYTGTTTVTAGELVATGGDSSTGVDIASGAIYTYQSDLAGRFEVVGSFTGTGVLQKTGTGNINFNDATFAFGSGALVNVQGGVLTGGSSRNEDWSANLSDLNIASGATFTSVEANVFVDTVTGEGTLASGLGTGADASYEQLTIGVDNGSDTFLGDLVDHGVFTNELGQHFAHVHKVGTGTQTFGGNINIRGDFDVQDGTVTLDTTGSMTFYPGENTVTNRVIASVDTGSPVVNINGAVNFDFTGANTTPGNTWTVLDPTNFAGVNVAITGVTSNIGAFTDNLDGTWSIDAEGNLWTFTPATATLEVQAGTLPSFTTWSTDNAGGQSPGEDFDGDGVQNGIEFFIGETGSSFTSEVLIFDGTYFWVNGGNIAASEYGTQFVVQTSPDLITWTDILITDPNLVNDEFSVFYTLPTGLGTVFVRLVVTPTLPVEASN
ncbi:MAG: beta strand repeat-containing protein [Luteolibacter sp.]